MEENKKPDCEVGMQYEMFSFSNFESTGIPAYIKLKEDPSVTIVTTIIVSIENTSQLFVIYNTSENIVKSEKTKLSKLYNIAEHVIHEQEGYSQLTNRTQQEAYLMIKHNITKLDANTVIELAKKEFIDLIAQQP